MNHSFKTFAGLLLGAVAIVGCQREPVNVNSTYDPDTQSVTTQFVLNVATEQNNSTKMSADAVQKSNNFLGINNAKLLTYATSASATTISEGNSYVNNATLVAGKVHDLGAVYSAAMITPGDNQSSSSHRVLDLSIPTQTDAVLFYATAVNSSKSINGSVQGSMTMHVDASPQNTYFDMDARIGNRTDSYYQSANLIALILNYVAQSNVAAQGSEESPQDGYTGLGALAWKTLGHFYEFKHNLHGRTTSPIPDRPMRALEEQLGLAYSTVTFIENNEYRSASASSIIAVMAELDRMALAAMAATPNFAEEANAKRLASNIHSRITLFFDSKNDYIFKPLSDIKTAAIGILGVDENDWNSTDPDKGYRLALSDMNQFPRKGYHIPSGAAQLGITRGTGIDDDDIFYYRIPNQALLNQVNKFQPSHYTYPAELAYYVNSPLRVTDESGLLESDYPNGVNKWNNSANWASHGWSFGKVLSTTKGVAVRYNIHYGVALLKASVAWKDKMNDNTTPLTYLEDNRSAKTDGQEENDKIYLSAAGAPAGAPTAKFELTGVLVGGQVDRVNWQFLKYGGDPGTHDQKQGDFPADHTDFNYVVYDDAINGATYDTTSGEMTGGAAVPTITGKENYTLVFDNYDATKGADSQNDVFVALEFKNNGNPFWGAENIIPTGGTFYLLAKLLHGTINNDNWPTDIQIPPLNADGSSTKISRVFIQDFMTTAVFRIGQTTLQHAFVSVPNLSTTQMSLGLSVDLSWSTGLSFDVEMDQH